MGQGSCKFGGKRLCDFNETTIMLMTKPDELIIRPDISNYEQIISKYLKESLASGVSYQGEMNQNNERHGIGKLTWPNNSYYIGNFLHNVCFGHGFLILNSEESREGEWKNDQLNGKGSIITKDYRYTGEFVKDLPHGKGEIFYTKGGRFEGDFCFGVKQGQGKLIDQEYTYVGHFDHDMMSGYGICTWKDGKKYRGNWVKNKMEGKGVFSWPDGSVYEGEYERGLKNGSGFLRGTDGKIVYKGYWLKGERYGEINIR